MDLRCRKALSTVERRSGAAKEFVNGSEMPKGVEHTRKLQEVAKGGFVNGSEMPKGVEHTASTL